MATQRTWLRGSMVEMSSQHRQPPRFVPNQDDDLHCMQAVYIMIVEMLTGEEVSMKDAEVETGFVTGLDTWPFQAFLSLESRGLHVVDHELFDAQLYAEDPRSALFNQNQDEEVTQSMLDGSNVELEKQRVADCLDNPAITFLNGRPTVEEVRLAVELEGAVFANLNSKALRGEEGYVGHMVLVLGFDGQSVSLSDPGLPPREYDSVTLDQFRAGWEYPSTDMANVIAVFPTADIKRKYLEATNS